ncbi:MAG: SusC/RagA family TonB-linked outer membrane protein [Cyclobacteriaceae bacterium]
MKAKLLVVSCFFLMLLIHQAKAQERTVSGQVLSVEDGESLPAVNVVVKGTTTGTVTDIDGNYSLVVPGDQTVLVFSFIGLQSQEINIGSRSVINIEMATDVQQLGEVVVTAIGIEREKRALGYAVTDLKSEQIAQKAEPDIVRSLQGKIPGVNIIGSGGAVGEGTNITIRGNSSLLGNNQPLFVVDGIPFDNTTYTQQSFSNRTTASNRSFDLDPNNIESITVLKGAAAAALYGSRASNGVIVVTTKAGRKGGKKGLEVTVNASYNQEEVANLPDYQTRYTQGNNFKYVDGNFGTWGASFDTDQPEWDVSNNANLILSIDPATGRPYVRHPYDRYNNPNRSPYFPEFASDSVLLQPFNTPERFLQTGNVWDYSVNVASGGEKANFSGGISRTTQEGIVPNNESKRTGMNFGGNVQLDNGLFVSGSFNFVRSELTSPPSAGLFTTGASVTERLLYTPPNVDVIGYPSQDANGDQAFYRPDNDNPIFLANNAPHTSDVDRYYGFLSFGYDITDWLNVTWKGGFNAYNQKNLNVLPVSTNVAPNGQIIQDDINYRELDANLLVTITRDLSEDIGLRAIVGYNANKRERERQAFQASGIIVRGINDLDNTESVIPFGGGVLERSYQAAYADLSFSYKDWGFLNLTGRNDWTSALPQNERSYFYGGVSGSLIFTEALNLKNNILNSGKLRAGWARVGSDPDPYQTQLSNFFTNGTGLGNNIASLSEPFITTGGTINTQTVANTLGNPILTPEFTKEWEIGTELTFWDNRIKADFTYYNRNTTDQIVPITTPPTSGFTAAVVNIGEVTNKGIEASLDITPVNLANGFSWNVFGNFTRNRNEVVELIEGLDEVFINGFGNDVQVVHIAGQPYGQLKGDVAVRSDAGDLLVDPSTGKLITAQEFEVIGDPNPDFILNVNNTFSWKGISLNALFEYRKGGDMFSATYNQIYGRGLVPGTIPSHPDGRRITLVIPGVVGDPGTQTAVLDENGSTIPNGTQLTVNDWFFINSFGSAGPAEFSVFDASTVRLREVTLSYDLPVTLLEKTPFGSASIAFTGRNLWFKALNFPDDLNFDPETNSLGAGNVDGLNPFQSGNAQGVDFGIIPTTKRYGVNISLTF